MFLPAKKIRAPIIFALYKRLKAEGWKNLVYLKKDKMYRPDTEGTVDGVHANDRGMLDLAEAFGTAVRESLKGSRK